MILDQFRVQHLHPTMWHHFLKFTTFPAPVFLSIPLDRSQGAGLKKARVAGPHQRLLVRLFRGITCLPRGSRRRREWHGAETGLRLQVRGPM